MDLGESMIESNLEVKSLVGSEDQDGTKKEISHPSFFYHRSVPDAGDECSSRNLVNQVGDDLEISASSYFPPSSLVAQRGQRVDTQLLRRRIIRCSGPLDESLANTVVTNLLYLDYLDSEKDIVMYINCPGGLVTAGMAIFDIMRHVRPDVSTVCVGLASSIGAFLLSAGTKGKRFSMPSSRIMIHQPLGGVIGLQTEIGIQSDELLHHKANLNTHLSLITGQSLDKVYADTERDYFMSPKEAIAYGLIDGLLVNPHKAPQPLEAAAAGQQ
ncbi:ATP-dependent Clp protease proteolytic subunit 5, chloroplastic [Linum grandiflorum]